jgi:hypothetical protein
VSGRITLVLVGVLASAGLPASAHAAEKSCRPVTTSVAKATHVRASTGLSCRSGRRVVRRYFRKVGKEAQRQGGRAQVRLTSGCRIGRFRCFTRYSYRTNRLRGRCRMGPRYVRFRETDYGPG